MNSGQPTKAVIYCRVSSRKQATEGSGLDSQEHRCREYAEACGLTVEAVFPDDISGGGDFMRRPGMVALLAYLDAKPTETYVVIFDDLKRYARDTEFHLKLRREMSARGAIRACLNFNFEDTPEGEFVETVIAAQGELERKQNQRQVVQKMKARIEQGYWVFPAPVGYTYETTKGHGKLLVRNEPVASVVVEAIEGFSSGRFQTHGEVRLFLQDCEAYPKSGSGYVHQSRVEEMMGRSLYAGLVEYERWGVGPRQGHHEALVSLETWQAVQRRKSKVARAPARQDVHADFPLRGFIACGDCGEPFTACWSKGRNKRYPYYLCDTKGCPSYRKSIRKEQIEGDFESLLGDMVPNKDLLRMLFDMMQELWDDRATKVDQHTQTIKRELKLIERKTSGLVDRIIETDASSAITAYEKRLQCLEMQKMELDNKLAKSGRPQGSFEEVYRTAFRFMANPLNLWTSQRLEDKRAVLKMTFADRLSYTRKEGYRTAETTLPFKALAAVSTPEYIMVDRRGTT